MILSQERNRNELTAEILFQKENHGYRGENGFEYELQSDGTYTLMNWNSHSFSMYDVAEVGNKVSAKRDYNDILGGINNRINRTAHIDAYKEAKKRAEHDVDTDIANKRAEHDVDTDIANKRRDLEKKYKKQMPDPEPFVAEHKAQKDGVTMSYKELYFSVEDYKAGKKPIMIHLDGMDDRTFNGTEIFRKGHSGMFVLDKAGKQYIDFATALIQEDKVVKCDRYDYKYIKGKAAGAGLTTELSQRTRAVVEGTWKMPDGIKRIYERGMCKEPKLDTTIGKSGDDHDDHDDYGD